MRSEPLPRHDPGDQTHLRVLGAVCAGRGGQGLGPQLARGAVPAQGQAPPRPRPGSGSGLGAARHAARAKSDIWTGSWSLSSTMWVFSAGLATMPTTRRSCCHGGRLLSRTEASRATQRALCCLHAR